MFAPDEIDKLLRFIGYGRLAAPLWFIGMEEGGGGEQNLRARLQFDPVMDLAHAQRMLGYGAYFELPRPKIQPTWRVLIQITLGVLGESSTQQKVAFYQARQLGSVKGDTLLTELMPLPAPTTGQWPYKDLFADPQFASREIYLTNVKPYRIKYLQGLIIKHQPRLVICYGKTYWGDYQRLFPKSKFLPATMRPPFKNHQVAAADAVSYGRTLYGGLVFMIAHPVARGMNASWRLDALAQMIRTTIQREIGSG